MHTIKIRMNKHHSLQALTKRRMFDVLSDFDYLSCPAPRAVCLQRLQTM